MGNGSITFNAALNTATAICKPLVVIGLYIINFKTDYLLLPIGDRMGVNRSEYSSWLYW